MIAVGHSHIPWVVLIRAEFRVGYPDFRTPTTPQRRTGARALSKATAMGAGSDGINQCSEAINASLRALEYAIDCINKWPVLYPAAFGIEACLVLEQHCVTAWMAIHARA